VPSPERLDIGLASPLGGTGIRISSGEPGMMSLGMPGIGIRFASF
jgi:hypothetical protein